MNIAHISDLHFSPVNLSESSKCFGFAVDDAIERDVDVAVISGDSTDHQLPANSPALIALARHVKRLADHCPVLMLQGTFSHEPAGMLQLMGLIGANHPIFIADKIGMIGLVENEWTEFVPADIADGGYELVVTCVPTVSKAELALVVGAENAAVEMGNYLAQLMESFASINRQLHQLNVPTVLVSHGTVDGSETEHGVPMAGLDHEFTTGSLFAAETDAVMLGHIHKLQSWIREFLGRKQIIAYPGSVGRFHYGEEGQKHYLHWDVKPGNPGFEAVVTPSRKMIDLIFDGAPNLEEIASVAEECAGAHIRVSYQVDEEYAGTVDRNSIKAMLAGAADVKIEGKVLPIERSKRSAGISLEASVTGRFKKWAEVTNTPMDGIEERLTMAETLSPEEIVKRLFPSSFKTLAHSPQENAKPECFADSLF